MSGTIQLDPQTIILINDYFALIKAEQPPFLPNYSASLEQIMQWLSLEIPYTENSELYAYDTLQFPLAAMQAALLLDIDSAIMNSIHKKPKQEKIASDLDRIKFTVLAIAGTLLAASEGFDSITTMAGILPFSAWVIFAIGVVYSTLSIMVFFGFDMVQVAQNLGIQYDTDPKLLDMYLLQKNELHAIRKKLSNLHLADLSIEDLQALNKLIPILQKKINDIAKASKQFIDALDSFDIRTAQAVIAICSGGLFFGTGYFAGQSAALYLFGFFLTSVSSTFWPIVAISMVVGISGFALYWNLQKSGLDKLVSTWMGIDEEKVDKIANLPELEEEIDKLENLSLQITSTKRLKEQSVEARPLSERLGFIQTPQAASTVDWGSNRYLFHRSNALKTGSVGLVADLDEVGCCIV